MEYILLKVIHIGALLMWIGPALGAWCVLKVAERKTPITNPVLAKVSRVFFWMVTLEHIAFLALLATGITMAKQYGWWGSDWLNQKLLIVMGVIVPLEIIDIVLGNVIVARASKRLHQGAGISVTERTCIHFYHGPFTILALMLIPITVFLVMYLAVGKVPF
jgi:uncharacterized membrane protein